jgi:hypothetical protein
MSDLTDGFKRNDGGDAPMRKILLVIALISVAGLVVWFRSRPATD